jgi:hypothetical protein
MRKLVNRGKFALPEFEPSEEQTLRLVVDQIRRKLPLGWETDFQLQPWRSVDTRFGRPDAVLTTRAPDGSSARLLVEAKRRIDPKLVPAVADQLTRYRSPTDDGGLVTAAFLSRRTRELLADTRLSYADATGNILLRIDRPAVYIESQGADTDPWAKPGDRPLRSLKGPTAGRIVRALCDFRPPFTVERLVRLSDTSLGSVARVFALLDREGLIERKPHGPVTGVKWSDLIRRWAEDYAFARSNTTFRYLEPRGITNLLQNLRSSTWSYAITGSLAGAVVAPVTSPALASIYVKDVAWVAEALRLRPAERGVNVLLVDPFDSVVFERNWLREGLSYAAYSQAAVDLLTGPGRSPAEGEALLGWMQEHEDAWRAG